MSGDQGPEVAVRGVFQALRSSDVSVIFVGEPDILQPLISRFPYDESRVLLEPAHETIGMEDSPSRAVRKRPLSSVVVAARLVREGRASGFFSPGNTGATMAAALLEMGRLKGVARPAVATLLPREDGEQTILMDSGANVDCKPAWLAQFAVMGETYAREILGKPNPSIGVLSNGKESVKGNKLSRSAYQRLAKLPYNFIGNVEGGDLYGGEKFADVVVCDGYTGNIVLKATEGLARSFFAALQTGVSESQLAAAGAFLLKGALDSIKKRMDAAEYGGAPLLGVRGACLIGHGDSSVKAYKNAVLSAVRFAERSLDAKIAANIRRFT